MLLFSTDIDGTIFDGPETAEIFAAFWKNLQSLPDRPLLVYNTGRLLSDVRALIAETPLPAPDYIISGVGTEIFDYAASGAVEEWSESLTGRWDFDRVHELVSSRVDDIEPQPVECQNPFKCSWFYRDKSREEIARIGNLIEEAGIEAQLIYSSDRDLDILPREANKGNALKWLASWKGIPLQRIAVAGDSGNDSSMFMVDEVYGVVVSNAEEALVNAVSGSNTFLATQPCARGVVEGLGNLLEPDVLKSTRDNDIEG